MTDKPQPGEQFFQQSMADLSRRLAERAGRAVPDVQAQAEARRRAMQAYDRERMRKLRLALTGAGAVFATAGIAWAVVMVGRSDLPTSPAPITSAQLAPPVAASTPPLEPQTVEAATATDVRPPVEPAQVAPPPPAPSPVQAASADPAPQVEQASVASPSPALGRAEIREVQKRLRGFGFDPGPVDGVAGRQTEIATQRYLEARGQPQTTPTDPQLLAQLREDTTAPPAAQPSDAPPTRVAQQPARRDWRGSQASAAQPAGRGSFDPFQPVKYAGTEITRFLSTVFR